MLRIKYVPLIVHVNNQHVYHEPTNPLLPHLCSAAIMGAFDNRLSERSEFPIVAHSGGQLRKQAVGGSLFFGNFLLAKQKKVTRMSRESAYSTQTGHSFHGKLDSLDVATRGF